MCGCDVSTDMWTCGRVGDLCNAADGYYSRFKVLQVWIFFFFFVLNSRRSYWHGDTSNDAFVPVIGSLSLSG